MDVQVSDLALSDVRDYVDRTFRPVAEEKGLDFSVEIDGENVPPTIVTDEQRLQQVLKNLLSNAFKFTDKGSVSPSAFRSRLRRRASTTLRCATSRPSSRSP